MDEYRINGLTIKENLLQLAENGNKKFTEVNRKCIGYPHPCPKAVRSTNCQR